MHDSLKVYAFCNVTRTEDTVTVLPKSNNIHGVGDENTPSIDDRPNIPKVYERNIFI